jgi:hypothetical protein
MSANIFISFASQDLKVAMTLCSALESRGFRCWISARDILPGENFQVSIVRAIRTAKIMLLVFTANSNKSEEMNKELALASQSKLIVVPLRVEDVAPNEAFAYEFATRQWIDFFADWELAIDQLASRIAAALNDHTTTIAAQPLAAVPAPPPAEPLLAESPVPKIAVATPLRPTPPGNPAPEISVADAGSVAATHKLIKLYLGLGVAALLALALAGLIAPTLHHRPLAAPRPENATLPIQKAAPAELGLQTASTPLPTATTMDAAGNAAAGPVADKPAAAKKKKTTRGSKADDYVPY